MEDGVDILLVENDAPSELLAQFAFEREAIAHVHFVRDGEEALDFLFCTGAYADRRMENPKLVLLDLKLTLVDGLDVLRQIRSDPRTALIPVVILTSSNEECDVEEAYSLHANSYIVKPLDFDQFRDVAKHVADYWLRLNRQPSAGSTSSQRLMSIAGAPVLKT